MTDAPTIASAPSLPRRGVGNALLQAPLLPTLLRMALPNLAALLVAAAVAIAETSYVGVLGTAPLAAIALVFPVIMLMQMLSSGAMGGGVSSAISRALGAGDDDRATALAMHALAIGAGAGLVYGIIEAANARPKGRYRDEDDDEEGFHLGRGVHLSIGPAPTRNGLGMAAVLRGPIEF